MTRKALMSISFLLGLMLVLSLHAPEETSANSANLNGMIDIRDDDGSYDANEAQAMINRLSQVDERILYHTNRAGVRIILMDFPLTELPEFEYLSGVVPRGWENTSSTWDDVPGAGGYTTAARIGYSDPGNGHSTINLELHEYAHAVDSYSAGFTVSESQEFRDIMAREKDNLFRDHEVPAYFDTPGEYFAETFAMYYLGGNASARLAERAPETYQFMSTFHNRLVSMENVTGNTAEFSWDSLEGATYYEVYRNDELVDTTQETIYLDEGLDTSTSYNYYIRAMDQNGNPLLTSYFRSTTTGSASDAPETDPSALENAIGSAEEIPLESRTPELQSALENAEAVLNDSAVTQEQLDETTQALTSAVESNEDEAVAEEETSEEPAEESAEEATSEEVTEEPTEETTSEEATEEATEEPTSEDATEEETAEEVTQEEETSEEAVETDEESVQAEAEQSNTGLIITAVVLLVLALFTAIILWRRRK